MKTGGNARSRAGLGPPLLLLPQILVAAGPPCRWPHHSGLCLHVVSSARLCTPSLAVVKDTITGHGSYPDSPGPSCRLETLNSVMATKPLLQIDAHSRTLGRRAWTPVRLPRFSPLHLVSICLDDPALQAGSSLDTFVIRTVGRLDSNSKDFYRLATGWRRLSLLPR